MIENNTKSWNDKSSNLISDYNNLKKKIKEYFPKVDEMLINNYEYSILLPSDRNIILMNVYAR
jgi:hypothetical protein